jgi:hypothetical protein
MINLDLNHVLEHGFTKLVYNPDLLQIEIKDDDLKKHLEDFSSKYPYARKSIKFIYKDDSLAEVNKFYGYFPNMMKRVEYSTHSKGLVYYIAQAVKMRKKPNVNQFTDKTVSDYNAINLMPEIEIIHNAFKDYFDALNLELETKIKNQIIEKYGKIGAYCFKDNETLSSIESEIDTIENKLKELKDAKHDLKKSLSINFIESTSEVHSDYKQDLVNTIKEEKRKERFFFD